MVHTVLLYAIHSGIHLSARAVKVSGMYMDAQGLATHHLCMHSRRIGQPVVGMNEIKLLRACQHAGNDGEVVDLLVQIAGITARKVETTQVIKPLQIVEVGIDVVAEAIVILGRMAVHAALHLVVIHIAPRHRHLAHVHNLEKMLLLARWLGHAEGCLHVTLHGQSLGDSIRGNCQTAVYFRGKLPSEHQYFHIYCSSQRL